MTLPWLKTKARYIWWLLSVLVGAAAELFLTGTHFLDMPMQLTLVAMRPLMNVIADAALSFRLEKAIVIIAVTSLMAIPRAAIAGIVLGVLAFKTPYPRTLLYSVVIWPLGYIVAQHFLLSRFEQGAKILGLPPEHAVAFQLELMQVAMFWIIISLVFYTFAFLAYLAAKKLSARSASKVDRSGVAVA